MSYNFKNLSSLFNEEEYTDLVTAAIAGVTRNPLFLEAEAKSTAQKVVNLITETERLLLEKGSRPEPISLGNPEPTENW